MQELLAGTPIDVTTDNKLKVSQKYLPLFLYDYLETV